jgi:predicted amidohydrolase
MVIMAGYLEKSELGIHNSHIIAFPDGGTKSVRKHGLTPTELNAKLVPGQKERIVFEINGVKCSLLICADGGVHGIYDDMKAKGVEMFFAGTAGGGDRKEYVTEADMRTDSGKLKYIDDRSQVFLTEAIRPVRSSHFGMAWASANALGDDGLYACHRGHCIITDKNRVLRAQIPGTLCVDHFLDQIAHAVCYF